MEAMLMYHGTVSNYLRPIRLIGLIPQPKNAWKIIGNDGQLEEPANVIYLTKHEHHARSYAESKAAYLATSPGETFEMYGDIGGTMLKLPGAIVIKNAKPVVLVVEVEETDDRLIHDPEDPLAFEYRGALPPSAVREVRRVTMPKSPHDDDLTDEEYDAETTDLFMEHLRRALSSPGKRRDPSPVGDSGVRYAGHSG